MSRRDPTSLLLRIWVAGERAAALLEDNLRADGVDAPFFGTLSLIGVHGPITPSELAERSGAPPTTVTDRVRRMVEAGDVERVPNPRDGRSHTLVLTTQGDALWRSGWPALRRTNAAIGKHLPRDAEEVETMLQELIEAAERASSNLNTISE